MGDLGLSSPCADSSSDSKDRAVWAATSGGKEGRRRPWFRAKTRSSMTTQAPKSMPSTSRGLSWEVFVDVFDPKLWEISRFDKERVRRSAVMKCSLQPWENPWKTIGISKAKRHHRFAATKRKPRPPARQGWHTSHALHRGSGEVSDLKVPSGTLTVCYWKLPFIVDLPIKNGDVP